MGGEKISGKSEYVKAVKMSPGFVLSRKVIFLLCVIETERPWADHINVAGILWLHLANYPTYAIFRNVTITPPRFNISPLKHP